jgi:hypothetical protein
LVPDDELLLLGAEDILLRPQLTLKIENLVLHGQLLLRVIAKGPGIVKF